MIQGWGFRVRGLRVGDYREERSELKAAKGRELLYTDLIQAFYLEAHGT